MFKQMISFGKRDLAFIVVGSIIVYYHNNFVILMSGLTKLKLAYQQ